MTSKAPLGVLIVVSISEGEAGNSRKRFALRLSAPLAGVTNAVKSVASSSKADLVTPN